MKLYVEDVASQLKISEQYARRIMKANKIKSINENRSWHTTQDEIDKFLESGEYVVNPDDRKRKSNTLPEIVALSFFSGGMGLDIGIKTLE